MSDVLYVIIFLLSLKQTLVTSFLNHEIHRLFALNETRHVINNPGLNGASKPGFFSAGLSSQLLKVLL